MTAINQNFSIYQGDNLTIKVYLSYQDGTPFAIIGAGARWRMARNNRSSHILEKIPALSTDGGKSIATVEFTPIDTESTTSGDYYHEMEVVDIDGKVFTVTVGTVSIRRTIIK